MKLSFILWGGLLARSTLAFSPSTSLAHHTRTSTSCGSSRPLDRRTALSEAFVDIEESAPRDMVAFDEWANTCGVQRANGFQLANQDGDWFAVTSEDLPQGSGVLQVPNNMILSSTQARQELPADEAVDLLNRLGTYDQAPQFYLFLKILVEWEKGDQSPWFPWLNSLPRLFYNSVSMTNACYECLPPLVFSLARIERVKFDNFVSALQKISFLTEETKANPDLAKWAFNVVYTRCWGSDEEKQIVPMGDMFNHGTETEIAINTDEAGNCILYTTRDVPAGSPLRMSYGDPTNPSHLFATYGFLDESSPATFCKIMSITPTQELKDIGYDFSKMLFYKDTGDVSPEVWDVLLYYNLGANNQREAQQAFYEAHMNGDADTKSAIHQQNILETSTALKTHIDSTLAQLDELQEKAMKKDVNEHPRVPIILKHNDFVKNTFLKVKARVDPLVEQASGRVA